MKRWKAIVTWQDRIGQEGDALETKVYLIDEVSELQEIVELGYDWNEAPQIDITLQYKL